METYQFWTLIGLIAAGFAWMISWLKSIDRSMNDIDKRVTVIETILSMMGASIKLPHKERTDP
ncbi:MAG TPA: hypothetical protein VFU89_03870 [Rhabdochlamydiaceae bacterium]|nr:hypothetical protein [Rhabdochlamydiaceae bacterium]